jgi:hypothetical protein
LVSVVDFEPKKSWVQAPNRPENKNKKLKFYQAIRNQNQIFHGFNPETTTETQENRNIREPRNFLRIFYSKIPTSESQSKRRLFSEFELEKSMKNTGIMN